MDEERFLKIGKELGYSGKELEVFIDKKVAEKIEREERAKEREIKQLELQEKLKQKEIELTKASQKNEQNGNFSARRVPKLPNFNENLDDMTSFIHRFELHAINQGWKKETWSMSLQSLLTGRALQVMSHLSINDANDYESLKSSLLNAFRCTDDGFRKKFRDSKPLENESFTAFVHRTKLYMSRWIELSEIDLSDGKNIGDLMLRDQILNSCNEKLSAYLREQKPKSSEELAKLAENFIAAHPDVSIKNTSKSNADVFCPGNNAVSQNVSQSQVQSRGRAIFRPQVGPLYNNNRRSTSLPSLGPAQYRRPLQCNICKRMGHAAPQCWHKNIRQDNRNNSRVICQICDKFGHNAKTCRQRNTQTGNTNYHAQNVNNS